MNINVNELSKDSLRKEFAKNPNEYYKVELFDKEGFKRHTCKIMRKELLGYKRERNLRRQQPHRILILQGKAKAHKVRRVLEEVRRVLQEERP